MLILNIEENKRNAKEFSKDYSPLIEKEKTKILDNLKDIILNIIPQPETLYPQQNNLIYSDLIYELENNVKKIFDCYFDNIDEIIILEPIKQKELIENFSNETIMRSDNNTSFIIYELLKILFIEKGYNTLDSEKKKKFFNYHKIKTCIYCNRNYIFNFEENGHVKGQIDHFYYKKKYPYLAMSYYNLIPCCQTCNYIKGTFDAFTKNSISPYLRNNNKLFNITPKSMTEFEFKPFNEELLEKLKIVGIYNEGHIDIVNDLYIKFFHENSNEYFKNLKKAHEILNLDEEDFYRFLTCSSQKEKDFHKRSFSKMTYDIIGKEFKSIYKK